jgi:hypothetical protein
MAVFGFFGSRLTLHRLKQFYENPGNRLREWKATHFTVANPAIWPCVEACRRQTAFGSILSEALYRT